MSKDMDNLKRLLDFANEVMNDEETNKMFIELPSIVSEFRDLLPERENQKERRIAEFKDDWEYLVEGVERFAELFWELFDGIDSEISESDKPKVYKKIKDWVKEEKSDVFYLIDMASLDDIFTAVILIFIVDLVEGWINEKEKEDKNG